MEIARRIFPSAIFALFAFSIALLLLFGASSALAADGKALLEQKCVLCHTLDRVTAKGATKPSESDWKAVTDRMKAKGCPITDQEQVEIVKYLTTTYSSAAAAATPAPAQPAATTPQSGNTATTTQASNADSTPAEQAKTGAEDWIFPIAGFMMILSGIYLRRRSEYEA